MSTPKTKKDKGLIERNGSLFVRIWLNGKGRWIKVSNKTEGKALRGKLKADDVLDRLTELFVRRGLPEHIRSDTGPEFTAKRMREGF